MTAGNDATILARPASEPAPAGKTCAVCGGTFPADFRVCPKDATPLGDTQARSADPLLGVVLAGTYRILKPLGEGGMGRIYVAEHLRLDRLFAVKVIQESFADRPDLFARFDREARAMSRVRSDHVVDVLDVLRVPDGRPCIVCELLEGEDLEKQLGRSGKLPLNEALALARQACAGLAAAHAQGVVHRDLKPSNLFLATMPGGGTTLKVLDFGVAKVAGEGESGLTHTGAVVGTPAYMAPEQARGSAEVDARSDVYALGGVLYRMLTGRAPYSGTDASATLATVLERDPTRPRLLDRAIPEGIELLIQNAMARDPKSRPQTIEELDDALAAFDPAGTGPLARGSALTADIAESAQKTHATVVPPATKTEARDAIRITQKARYLRPQAVIAAGTVVLAASLAAGASLGLLVSGLREGTRLGTADIVLVLLAAGVAFVTSLATTVRALRGTWQAAPRIAALTSRLWLGLGAGLLVLGLSELCARGVALVLLEPDAPSPLVTATRIALSAVIGTAAAVFVDR